MRRACQLLIVLACVCLPASAQARESASLHAELSPERLGHGTTIVFGFRISTAAGEAPSPLTALDMRYPRDLGIGVSGLGVATCSAAMLEAVGSSACPADSVVGFGSALVEIPFGPGSVQERAGITIVRAPTEAEHLMFLMYVNGSSPVIARTVLPAALLPSSRPFGESLRASVPLIQGLPGAPSAAIVSLRATLGPRGLTYEEHTSAGTVSYRPKGILLPPACPRGGFRFAATFAFLDGSHASSRAAVACP